MRISDWSSDVCSSDLIRHAGAFGDTVRNVIHGVITSHFLLLQEVGRVAFTLRENGHEHVGARTLPASRRLDVDDSALDDAERKSVVSGKSVAVRVDLGVVRSITKKHKIQKIKK